MKQDSDKISFAPCDCPAGHLITARSYLVDRFVPDCEIIELPAKKSGGGELSFTRRTTTCTSPDKSRQRLARLRRVPRLQEVKDATLIDFRSHVPQNWAHFLNNHLPIFFVLAHHTGLNPSDALLILPANTPPHILGAAGVFGLDTLCTDAPVQGHAIDFTSDPWTGIRSIRADWVKLPYAQDCLDRADIRDGHQGNLPDKAFISRRGTRDLENETRVETFLTQRGYTKIYPEDLSVTDQFKLFEQAKSIVAIHGAALAPLLYRSDKSRLEKLIELFPCGHMTDVYRVMAHQVGCKWIGVRGKIKPEHIQPAYDLKEPFLKYSLQSFEIDLQSLELALDMI